MLGTYSAVGRSPEALAIVNDAERRLAQLRADIEQPKIFDDDDAPQAPISGSAIERAGALVRSFATSVFGPSRRIAIFAMPDGGLQLQSTGVHSAVSIEIPPNPGDPFLGEFAGDDEYHSRSIHDVHAAAQFLALAM